MTPAEPTQDIWLRVLRLDAVSWLGLVGEVLHVGDERRPKRQLNLDVPTGLLPCLERPYDAVTTELHNRELELSLAPGTLSRLIPLSALPVAAVETRMDYWAALALDWADPLFLADRNETVLSTIAESSWASQRTRHRARKMLRSKN